MSTTATAEPKKAIPPELHNPDVPALSNPIFARFAKKARCKVQTLVIVQDDETYEFLIHEMDAEKKGLLEAEMGKNAKQDDGDPESFVMTSGTFHMRAETILLCVTTMDRQPIITRDEIPFLKTMPSGVVDQLFDAAFELNGMNRKKAEVETEKKSNPIPS